jgi:Uma2 family endonuclease
MSRVAPFAPRSNLAASLADRVVRDVRSWDLYEAILACRGEASRGVEPDECYEVDGPKPAPDLAIEVVWTHGGIDKLSIYRAFGVREVWSWIDGRIDVHALRGQAYERIPASELSRTWISPFVASLVARGDQTAAVRELRERLRGR